MFFSIIIPTYNRAHLILNTLNSIKSQDFKDYEVIIVDDGSNDNTKQIIENYIQTNSLKNWNYFYKINEERGAARNCGILNGKGEFVTFLDSDDLLYANHLRLAYDFIVHHPKCELFHCAYEFKDKRSGLIRKVNYPNSETLNHAILDGNVVSCFGVFLKRDIIGKVLFNENRDLSGSEDWLLWLQLCAKYPFYIQRIVTGCMVQHEERSVLNFNSIQLEKRAEILFHNLLEDADFKFTYGVKKIKNIYAHMLTYGALHLVLSGKKRLGLKMFAKAITVSGRELFRMRSLGIVKNLFKNSNLNVSHRNKSLF